MRKLSAILIILFVLLLLSCQSSRSEQSARTERDERDRSLLVSSMQDALFSTEAQAFRSKASFQFDSSFQQYDVKLAEFRRLEDEYLMMLSEILRGGVEQLTDLFLAELSALDISDPNVYIDRGYASISEELEKRCSDSALVLIGRTLEAESFKLDGIYSQLEKEADNWRVNLNNLSLVGVTRNADELRKPAIAELALWARDQYFNLLSDNEVTARYRSGK